MAGILKKQKKQKQKTPAPSKVVLKKEFRANARIVLMAYLAFKNPRKARMKYLVPKDRAAWLDVQVKIVMKKANIIYLTEKEIKKVIIRARHNIGRKKHEPIDDPDLPECFHWTKEQIAEWIEEIGYPQYKEAFLINYVTGKRLIEIDASALNKMGLRYFDDIQTIAQKIRELLKIHRPNILRAVMRKVPFEIFLNIRRFHGQTYDLLTFEDFCDKYYYPYEILETNKCALIEPTCAVYFQEHNKILYENEISSDDTDNDSSDRSIYNAPSVEITVRHIIVRDKVVNEIIENLLKCVFRTGKHSDSLSSDEISKNISNTLLAGMEELGLDEESYQERIKFAREIAQEIVNEMKKTANVMKDIDEFKNYLSLETTTEISNDDILQLKDITQEFLNETGALAVLLATGQFDIENIFKQEPEFYNFVNEIVDEAEYKTNSLEPPTQKFLDEIMCEAKLKVLKLQFPNLDFSTILATKRLACRFIDKIFSGECDPMDLNSCIIDIFPEDIREAVNDSISTSSSRKKLTLQHKNKKTKITFSKANNFGYGKGKNKSENEEKGTDDGEEESSLTDDNKYTGDGQFSSSTVTETASSEQKRIGSSKKIDKRKQIMEKKKVIDFSGEGSGSPASGEGSNIDSDGIKKQMEILDGMSFVGEDGSIVQHVVAHAKVDYESTSSGVGERISKKRGEFTLSTSSNPHSSSDDKKHHLNTKDIWEEIDALKVPSQAEQSDDDLNARTPKMRTKGMQQDSQALLKEKLRRADFAQRWAEQEELLSTSTAVSKGQLGKSNNPADRKARLLRMTADQIVSDVVQMALTHLLLQAQSGENSNEIMAALKYIQIQPDEDEEEDEHYTQIPEEPLVENNIPKLLGRDPRGTRETGLWGWPSDKLPPAPDVRNHLRCRPPPPPPPPPQSKHPSLAAPHLKKKKPVICEPKDVVCFYPVFQNWKIN